MSSMTLSLLGVLSRCPLFLGANSAPAEHVGKVALQVKVVSVTSQSGYRNQETGSTAAGQPEGEPAAEFVSACHDGQLRWRAGPERIFIWRVRSRTRALRKTACMGAAIGFLEVER